LRWSELSPTESRWQPERRRLKHRVGLNAAALDGEPEIPGAASAECGERLGVATIGVAGGFHGFGWSEEAQWLVAVFQPSLVAAQSGCILPKVRRPVDG
jgi:hypothetical protein